MDIRSIQPASQLPLTQTETPMPDLSVLESTSNQPDGELREAFTDFVGQTLFGSMLNIPKCVITNRPLKEQR